MRTGNDHCFIEIPIYRSEFHAYRDKMKKCVERRKLALIKAGHSLGTSGYVNAIEHYKKKYCANWHYNQVTGWLCLYVDHRSVVKAFYYKRNDGRFELQPGNEMEVWMEDSWTSAQVFQELRAALVRLSETDRYKRRYLELESLDTIGPHVNWKQLVFPK